MRRDQLNTMLYVALGVMFFSGGWRMLFPMIIIYYVAKSIINSQYEEDRRERRDSRRDYDRTRRERNYREEQRRRREDEADRRMREQRRREEDRRRAAQARPRPPQRPKNNPYKTSGINKFKEYDYDGAIEDFKKALEVDGQDIAVHFNLACCYSLNEEKEKAYYHLSKAVAFGFKDFQRIQDHDALAYIRIQDDFEEFKKNGYRIANASSNPAKQASRHGSELLDQLKKLQELRERGVLTDEEFVIQKERLLK